MSVKYKVIWESNIPKITLFPKNKKAKIIIPNNAYASSSDPQGWKCKSLYYENNNACFRLPSNAVAKSYGDGFYCKTGYKKSGDYCTKENSEIYIDGDKYVGPLKNGKPHG